MKFGSRSRISLIGHKNLKKILPHKNLKNNNYDFLPTEVATMLATSFCLPGLLTFSRNLCYLFFFNWNLEKKRKILFLFLAYININRHLFCHANNSTIHYRSHWICCWITSIDLKWSELKKNYVYVLKVSFCFQAN